MSPPEYHAHRAPFKRIKRLDGRSKLARKSRQLLAAYSDRLGAAIANDPAIHDDLLRLCEIESVCWDWRARAMRHESVDLVVLDKMERFCRRIKITLGLDKPPPPPKRRDMRDINREIARHAR
jgi:hypothetical protein